MLKDYFVMAFKNLRKRGLRTWLTLIGIFIGIMAVVSLISLGQGLQGVIQDEFENLGADKIMVRPAGSAFSVVDNVPNPLTKDDVDALKKISGVELVGYSSFRPGLAEWGSDDFRAVYVMSIPSGREGDLMRLVFGAKKVLDGRELRDNDKNNVFVGYAYKYSSRVKVNLDVGRKIFINDKEFQIIGVKKSDGNEMDDFAVYLTEDSFKNLFDVGDSVDMIVLQVSPGRVPADLVEPIEKALRDSRNVKKGQEDFEVQTFEDFLESFLVLFGVIQAILIGIAGISLFVGGVGIMNTMYTAVVERTRDIGVMKAIGARNSDIRNIFLIESGFLGLVGGMLGVLFGYGISKAVEIFGNAAIGTDLLRASFPAWLIVGALLFAFILGSVSGLLPALQASKMNPVDALRTE